MSFSEMIFLNEIKKMDIYHRFLSYTFFYLKQIFLNKVLILINLYTLKKIIKLKLILKINK